MKEKLILTCKDCGVVFNHEQEFIPNDFDKNADKIKPLVAQKKVIKAKINDQLIEISGEKAFMPLGSFLRNEEALNGTKIVCAEGPIHVSFGARRTKRVP